MTTEDWMGVCVAALYPLVAVIERVWPARKFPKIPHWHVIGGVGLFYLGLMNALVLGILPQDWLAAHRLFDLARLGLLPSVLIGQLLVTLAMYAWHRATHEIDVLWRGFHQIHHAPRHLNIYVSGVNHPTDLAVYIAIPAVIGLFILGVDPLAAAILGNLAGFNAFLQHSNVRTPGWLACFFQRPEAHCIHHERGLHRYNYSDLPLWDIAFGTFHNPATWQGETGFDEPADQRYGAMLAFVDVNAPLIGTGSFGQTRQSGES
jgi:sterol desaturase/sphingolipid hydroxylase (fatty acid hydroxylase superfamily)